MTVLGLLLGLALASAGALIYRGPDSAVPLFDDRVLGLLVGGTGLLVVLVCALASWADRSGEDDPVLKDALLH